MIVIREELLHDQMGMEQAMEEYLRALDASCPDTLNAILRPELVACDYEEQSLTMLFETKPWMANPNGIVHGGITAAVLDLVMGLLCRYCAAGRMTPTLHVDVNYLRSIPIPAAVCVRAEVTKIGASVCTAVGTVYEPETPRRLLATASGSYFAKQE